MDPGNASALVAVAVRIEEVGAAGGDILLGPAAGVEQTMEFLVQVGEGAAGVAGFVDVLSLSVTEVEAVVPAALKQTKTKINRLSNVSKLSHSLVFGEIQES